jgi:K+-sensing histidine kinase KdpD
MRFHAKSFVGIGFCVCAAVFLTFSMNQDEDVRLAAPFICLFIVSMTAFLCGRLEAILGSAGASLTFWLFLFPPLGSFHVANPEERIVLATFQLAAIGIAFTAPRRRAAQESYFRALRRGRGQK